MFFYQKYLPVRRLTIPWSGLNVLCIQGRVTTQKTCKHEAFTLHIIQLLMNQLLTPSYRMVTKMVTEVEIICGRMGAKKQKMEFIPLMRWIVFDMDQ